MKKIIIATGLASLLSLSLNADFLKFEIGAGGWNQDPSGTVVQHEAGSLDATYTSNETTVTNAYVWMLLKHPIPIVPNIRLEYAKLNDEGVAKGSFDNFNAPLGSASSIDITEYDVIPYYNLLDDSLWITLDLGVDLRIQTTDFKANNVELVSMPNYLATYEDETTTLIPLLYARARVEIPSTDIGLESDVKFITYDGSTVYDIRAKVDYTLSFVPVVQPALEIGYRIQKFDVTDDDTVTDLTFAGVYGGLMLRF